MQYMKLSMGLGYTHFAIYFIHAGHMGMNVKEIGYNDGQNVHSLGIVRGAQVDFVWGRWVQLLSREREKKM